ncbi:MAG: S9 family peptidase [Candidatus Acidiferrum sp.]
MIAAYTFGNDLEGLMRSRSNTFVLFVMIAVIPFFAGGWVPLFAQQANTSVKALTVERIFNQESLGGKLTRGIAWAPDGKQLCFFESRGEGKTATTELWIMDAATGKKKLLVSAEKLETVLPVDSGKQTQATGLGRHAPSQVQWAPDGAAFLFEGPTSLAWFDLKTQSGRTLVSGKEPIADPKISPDGRMVSFVREHNLWLVDVANGKERTFTTGGTEEVRKGELDWVYPEELEIKTAYWWAPDSSAIAYLEMDESKVTQFPLVDFESFTGEAEMQRYPVAGGANPVVRVMVGALKGGEPRAMDIGAETDIYVPRVNWLNDSKQVAIQRLNRAQDMIDLILAEAASGKSRVVLTEKDQYWINVSDDLYFFKDGKRFLWSSERDGYRHLYLYNLDGKQLARLTKGEWEVTGVQGVDEGKGVVYFTATEKSPLERQLYSVGLDGSGFLRVTKEEGTHAVNLSPEFISFIDIYSNSNHQPRQVLLRADGTRIAALNENKLPELGEYHLSPVEFLTVKAHDGMPLNAMMIKPPDFNPAKKYPVLVYTYGGPHAQVVLNQWGGTAFLWHELMAQKGYIVFALDNRGSAGRGHLFEEPIHYRFGAVELSDQRDGVQYLKHQSFVDPSRIGIWGWSYGGHMTLHAMFSDPEDFKAGFAGGPVTNWRFYDTIYTERYIGLPAKNEESYESSSPIEKVAHLKGKLLIAHGTGDDNVHYSNTLALIDDLIEAGKYVEVIALPGRGHGAGDIPARQVMWRRVTQFFLDNL